MRFAGDTVVVAGGGFAGLATASAVHNQTKPGQVEAQLWEPSMSRSLHHEWGPHQRDRRRDSPVHPQWKVDSLAAPFDVVVIGAGPAGLFAAHDIVSGRAGVRLAVIESGAGWRVRMDRERAGIRGAEWLSGVGGAGFFIGGRLSLDPTSLSGKPINLPDDGWFEYVGRVENLLNLLSVSAESVASPPDPLAELIDRAAAVGLNLRANYPAMHLSWQDRQNCLHGLQSHLESSGAEIVSGSSVTDIACCDGSFHLALGSSDISVKCRHLLIAPGRTGASWLARVLASLNVPAPLEASVGVRVETLSTALDPLTSVTPDPRFFLETPEGQFRTYAFVRGGHAVLSDDDSGPARIGCRPGGADPTANTSFSLLWRSIEARLPEFDGPPARQSVASMLRASNSAPIRADCQFRPSLDLPEKDLTSHWPAPFWRGSQAFLGRLFSLTPGLGSAPAVVYSPAVERVWLPAVDKRGRTSLSGLYLAGDGAGISQGAMAAAISGLMAATGILEQLRSE